MKVKENQQLKSFDFLTLISSILLILSVSLPIISRNFEATNAQIAQKQLNKHSDEIIQNITSYKVLKSKDNIKNRGLASVAPEIQELGRDPWGSAYHYEIIKNENSNPVEIVIWSNGPNGLDDTKHSSQASTKDGSYKALGDDLLVVKSLK